MLVRKLVLVGTLFTFEEDKMEGNPNRNSGGTRQTAVWYRQVLSADSGWYGLGEFGVATPSVRRNKKRTKNSSTCATFVAKVRYGEYLQNVFEKDRVRGPGTVILRRFLWLFQELLGFYQKRNHF